MNDPINVLKKLIGALLGMTVVVSMLLVTVLILRHNPELILSTKEEKALKPMDTDRLAEEIKDGVHQPTGFLDGEGLQLVITNCTGCHSSKLVTQNRATRDGWMATIRWMQATQGLWDLGENEEQIVDYLSTYYAPEKEGRRRNLEVLEWYELD